MLERRFASWLLALALIFGQAAAFAHALGHLDPHDADASETVCEVCVAQAQLGSAAPSAPNAWVPSARLSDIPPAAAPVRVGERYRAACARAPPAPSSL